MNKADWGIKRVCLECSTRFYDFSKTPIICPNCNSVFDPDYLLKKKTRNSQEKNEDIESIGTDVEFGDIVDDPDEVIVTLDDSDDDIPLNDAKP